MLILWVRGSVDRTRVGSHYRLPYLGTPKFSHLLPPTLHFITKRDTKGLHHVSQLQPQYTAAKDNFGM